MTEPYSLETLQQWLQSVITHPHGVEAGTLSSAASTLISVSPAEIERVILPSHQLTSFERLRIYGDAYFGRLLECLRAQYPAVRHSLGDEAFNALAFGYLVSHPSTSYTLSVLGDRFDDFLLSTRPERGDESELDYADFLIDLARVERVYAEVFDGPGPERLPTLDVQYFSALTAEDFANSRLSLHDCVKLLELRFPVHEYATCIRRGIEPSPMQTRSVHLVVTRRDYIVRRFEVTPTQFRLLEALKQQSTVGEAISQAFSNHESDLDKFRSDLHHWFREWTAAPLFSGLVR